MTFAEKLLWSRIRSNQLGYHFRRQHPLLNYVLDFYCVKLQLVIEVDGSVHDLQTVKEADKNKQKSLESYELLVIRFTNEEVINGIDKVISSIKNVILTIQEKGKPNVF